MCIGIVAALITTVYTVSVWIVNALVELVEEELPLDCALASLLPSSPPSTR